jgi:hypothetical protein
MTGTSVAGRWCESVETGTPMKVACSSSALHRAFESGDLTQLEFVDLSARRWLCDGIVLDVRHFPRTDSDYLAQIKKMAADCGLGVAALQDAEFFGRSAESMADSLRYAVEIGAPLLSGSLARDTDTFAAASQECKRVLKETDSAWLRLGPEPLTLDRTSDAASLTAQTVLLWSSMGAQTERSVDETVSTFATFRGHVCLDEVSGDAGIDDTGAAVRAWKTALAAKELNRT